MMMIMMMMMMMLMLLLLINNSYSYSLNTIINTSILNKNNNSNSNNNNRITKNTKNTKNTYNILCSTNNNDNNNSNKVDNVDDITKKYGLEVGLWKAFKSGGKIKPTDLLKKYGGAYLLTSITLAIISYALCYLLVSKGIDVGALLMKIGIKSTAAASGAGTASIAYAIHKASSPIRFPPTVLLTPIISEWFSKKKQTPQK
jgi:hypothetical protein